LQKDFLLIRAITLMNWTLFIEEGENAKVIMTELDKVKE